jgi:hypothetical protein
MKGKMKGKIVLVKSINSLWDTSLVHLARRSDLREQGYGERVVV